MSKNDDPEKLTKSGAQFFRAPGFDLPFVKGCACWAVFDVIREPHNESAYDLFIGTCVGAWADPRVIAGGHWNLEGTPRELRPLHYVAGGHFWNFTHIGTVYIEHWDTPFLKHWDSPLRRRAS